MPACIQIGTVEPALEIYNDDLQWAIDCWLQILVDDPAHPACVTIDVASASGCTFFATGGVDNVTGNGLPDAGTITLCDGVFPTGVCDQNLRRNILKHEVGHILFANPLIPAWVADTSTGFHTGTATTGVWQTAGGTGSPPMADAAHFDETGVTQIVLGANQTNTPVGVVTMPSELDTAAMGDVGWNVLPGAPILIDTTVGTDTVLLDANPVVVPVCVECGDQTIPFNNFTFRDATIWPPGSLTFTGTTITGPATCGTLGLSSADRNLLFTPTAAGTCTFTVDVVADGTTLGTKTFTFIVENCEPCCLVADANQIIAGQVDGCGTFTIPAGMFLTCPDTTGVTVATTGGIAAAVTATGLTVTKSGAGTLTLTGGCC